MRRGVTPDAVALRAQRLVDHRGHGAFAVGARDVHGADAPLGVPESRAEGLDA